MIKENEIELYFDFLFDSKFTEYEVLINIVRSFCNLKGVGTEGYVVMLFSSEYEEYGIEYFGEEKVYFEFLFPDAGDDNIRIVSYNKFFEIVLKHGLKYANQHEDKKEEIIDLLNQLKIALRLNK